MGATFGSNGTSDHKLELRPSGHEHVCGVCDGSGLLLEEVCPLCDGGHTFGSPGTVIVRTMGGSEDATSLEEHALAQVAIADELGVLDITEVTVRDLSGSVLMGPKNFSRS